MSSPEKTGEDPAGRGFTITDRRISSEAPPEPPGGDATPEVKAGDAGKPAAQATPGEAPAGAAGKKAPPLPPVDFATFILSLGSSALMNLGEVERPGTGGTEKNLPLAKHSIDLLSMLEEKTKGNLSAAEAQLLENLLFDLRLRYVEATRK